MNSIRKPWCECLNNCHSNVSSFLILVRSHTYWPNKSNYKQRGTKHHQWNEESNKYCDVDIKKRWHCQKWTQSAGRLTDRNTHTHTHNLRPNTVNGWFDVILLIYFKLLRLVRASSFVCDPDACTNVDLKRTLTSIMSISSEENLNMAPKQFAARCSYFFRLFIYTATFAGFSK